MLFLESSIFSYEFHWFDSELKILLELALFLMNCNSLKAKMVPNAPETPARILLIVIYCCFWIAKTVSWLYTDEKLQIAIHWVRTPNHMVDVDLYSKNESQPVYFIILISFLVSSSGLLLLMKFGSSKGLLRANLLANASTFLYCAFRILDLSEFCCSWCRRTSRNLPLLPSASNIRASDESPVTTCKIRHRPSSLK